MQTTRSSTMVDVQFPFAIRRRDGDCLSSHPISGARGDPMIYEWTEGRRPPAIASATHGGRLPCTAMRVPWRLPRRHDALVVGYSKLVAFET